MIKSEGSGSARLVNDEGNDGAWVFCGEGSGTRTGGPCPQGITAREILVMKMVVAAKAGGFGSGDAPEDSFGKLSLPWSGDEEYR